MRQRQRNTRAAFTLIEMLIVIAIIVILMALLLPAIMRVWGYVDEVRVSTEVKRLAEACELFKTKHNMYPPSRIVLRENNNYQVNFASGQTKQEQAEQYSVECLARIFGLNTQPYGGPGPGSNLANDLANGLWHDWNGNGQLDPAPMYLEGEEALVFFLGGMRYGPLTDRTPARGFHQDLTRPTVQSTGERKGPYFEFDTRRITYEAQYVLNAPNHSSGVPGSLGWFPVYLDRYGSPYVYFLARGNTQDNYHHVGSNAVGVPGSGPDHPLWLTDCARLTDQNPTLQCAGFNWQTTVFIPYVQHQAADSSNVTRTTYFAPDRFQIISAGRDNLFGSGGQYNPSEPESSRFNFMPALPDPDAIGVAPFPAPPLPKTRKAMNHNNFTNFVNAKLVR